MGYPRVLIISHNCLNKTNNMGKTISAFFNSWNSESLAQLYFLPELPDTSICNNFFRITDYEILKSQEPGIVISQQTNKPNEKTKENSPHLKVHKKFKNIKLNSLVNMARDTLWISDKWKTKKLFDWIDDFNPQLIFFAAGNYRFSMNIAMFLSKKYNIPLVAFFGDDYYLNNSFKLSIFHYINRYLYKKKFSELFSSLHSFFSLTDILTSDYSKIFNKKGHTLMVSCDIEDTNSKKVEDKISYVGNIGVGRFQTLVELGRILKELGFHLDVYSAQEKKSILKYMTKENGIIFHGAVPAIKAKEIIEQSTLIIHTESFRKDMIKRVKYSLSTKIAESLASKTCLFVYGPCEIASVKYLSENNAAFIINDKSQLKNGLNLILNTPSLREKYISNALTLARARHDYTKNSEYFYNVISEICEGNGKTGENSSGKLCL